MSVKSNKETAVEFLRLIGAGEIRKAYHKFVRPGFRHHNPWFAGDADSLMKAMEQNAASNPRKQLRILRVLEDGDLVAVHSHVRMEPQAPGAALVHIFRFEEGGVVELWDIGQPVPEHTPNEHGMF
ncbi:MAG TPA: nuclear transport factor 2 family protein [Candidatus Binatia bacterium]|nr:nuclear transport factor 2 family protein [Candidatus Binatia bacterium]